MEGNPISRDDIAPFGDAPLPAQQTFPMTDTGNAERLVAKYGDRIRYCFDWKSWLAWDGMRWLRDPGETIGDMVKQTVRDIVIEAFNEADDSDDRGKLLKWAGSSESERRRRSMERLAQSEPGIPVTPDELDQDPMTLTLNNGILDLSDGQLLPHDQHAMMTKLAPVTFDPKAACPLWLSFLDRIMDGNEDLIRFLQRSVGYSMTGSTREQCFFILHGCGANGKSVFVSTITALLGEYANPTSSETFLLKPNQGVRNDIADLRGARFVPSVEVDEGRAIAESVLKWLTGSDMVKARFLYSEHFVFQPTFKIWMASNHKPIVRGTDAAIWRRIKLVPFSVAIPEHEQDKSLPEKLQAELSGILNWALQGCLEWQADGLGAPREVESATAGYRGDQDVIGQFIDECCLVDGLVAATFRNLYSAYCAWAEANREKPVTGRNFADRLTERGFESYRDQGERWRAGIGLVK